MGTDSSIQTTWEVEANASGEQPDTYWRESTTVEATLFASGASASANVFNAQYVLEASSTSGSDTITLDYSALGLLNAPSMVAVIGVLGKTSSGQDNIYGSVIDGWSATTATVSLNANADATGRKLRYVVIL
jgi:hypothetical protein